MATTTATQEQLGSRIVKIQAGGTGVEAELEAGYAKLQATTPAQCHSLIKKYLTREVLDKLKDKHTSNGATLFDVVQSGFANLDSSIGLYAPDAEAYDVFAELFDPVIDEYHLGCDADSLYPSVEYGNAEDLVDVDPEGRYVISTRIRWTRNLAKYPFNTILAKLEYEKIESECQSAFEHLEGELSGRYQPLASMSEATQKQMAKDHFLFGIGDRFLEAANMCRYWPTGRGIHCNEEKTFLVWVNEEDALRIISMEMGGDVRSVYSRWVNGVKSLASRISFAHSDRLGFLTNCPTNLGTAIRASVLIKLPLLAGNPGRLQRLAAQHKLQVRGMDGEHSESVGGVYDISNKRRLGLTEFEAVKEMQDGVLALVKMEQTLEEGIS